MSKPTFNVRFKPGVGTGGGTSGTGPPGFTPPPEPWAWWDFSDATTLVLDSNSKIQTIIDKSGHGHDAAQSDPALRPSTSTVNSLTAGLFSKTTKTYLTTSTLTSPLPQPSTWLAVFTQDSATSSTYFPGVFDGLTVATRLVMFCNGSNNQIAIETATDGNLNAAKTAPFTQQQVTAIFNGSSSVLRLNAVTSSGTSGNPLGTNDLAGVNLGRQINDGGGVNNVYLDGKLCEIIVYASQLTSTQYTALESALKTKWLTP